MADVSITASNVLAANVSTVSTTGTAAQAINAGQVIYLSSSDSLLRLAQATNQANSQAVVGIALDNAAGSAQPISYVTAGDLIVGTSSTLTTGTTYVVSAANAGGIAPSTDPSTGNYITVLGVAVSPTILRVVINPIGGAR